MTDNPAIELAPDHRVEAFLALLRRSNLLSLERLSTLSDNTATAKNLDERRIAGWLVQKDWLTKWQAEQLLAGRPSFFLGKYKLLEKLGAGGMGSVYKAEQTGFGRSVAVKVMAPELVSNPRSVARFRREIQAAAALHHPNIIAAYDADSVGKIHFLVMEYVVGRDLDHWLVEHGRMSIPAACECIRQAALGLQHAHERGMVHRDIKPANLLIVQQPNGEVLVKILDMGLARFAVESEAAGVTKTGMVIGTPDYMAPEQANDSKTADIRSDIYSLGCTLFELLSGQTPFRGATVVEKLMQRTMYEAPLIGSVRPGTPGRLEAIIAKALSRQPANRYQTPIELAQALTPWANPEATSEFETTDEHSAAHEPSLAATIELTMTGSSSAEIDPAVQPLVVDASPDDSMDEFLPVLREAAEQVASGEQTSPALSSTFRASDGRLDETPRRSFLQLAGIAFCSVFALSAVGLAVWQQLGHTTIVVDIPPAERNELELFVDGKRVWLRETGPIEVAGSWGERRIKLSRPKYHDIGATVTLKYGEKKTYAPEWKFLQPPALVAPFLPKTAKESQEAWARYLDRPAKLKNAIGMEFTLIPPGEFMMGTTQEDADKLIAMEPNNADLRTIVTSEVPRHKVRITKPFYMQTTEVTLGQFRKFVEAIGYKTEGERYGEGGYAYVPGEKNAVQRPEYIWSNAQFSPTDDHPVVFVSWKDAVAFANWLHSVDGKFYRLPTEAEWEFCCRSGTDTWWCSGGSETGVTDYAWYVANHNGETQPAGRKKANAFGLFDMHGNVWEWCADWVDERYYARSPVDDPPGPTDGAARVLRGGYYHDGAVFARSGRRHWNGPTARYRITGFRLSRTYD